MTGSRQRSQILAWLMPVLSACTAFVRDFNCSALVLYCVLSTLTGCNGLVISHVEVPGSRSATLSCSDYSKLPSCWETSYTLTTHVGPRRERRPDSIRCRCRVLICVPRPVLSATSRSTRRDRGTARNSQSCQTRQLWLRCNLLDVRDHASGYRRLWRQFELRLMEECYGLWRNRSVATAEVVCLLWITWSARTDLSQEME